jgi:hypothetical protein
VAAVVHPDCGLLRHTSSRQARLSGPRMNGVDVRARADAEALRRAMSVMAKLLENAETVVIGKREQIRIVLTALACGGHVLLEDVPGTAKTVLARAIAGSIEGAVSNRIQCTPDIQPTDVTGLSIWDPRERSFEFRAGPVFANVLLVDEINRAMPKTQSALLEAMAERQVTVDGTTRPLPPPFFLVATENPIEQEGTFPLPEAQLDRFFLRASLGYPDEDEELRIVQDQHGGHPLDALRPVASIEDSTSHVRRRSPCARSSRAPTTRAPPWPSSTARRPDRTCSRRSEGGRRSRSRASSGPSSQRRRMRSTTLSGSSFAGAGWWRRGASCS